MLRVLGSAVTHTTFLIYLLAVVSLHVACGLSLVDVSEGYSSL